MDTKNSRSSSKKELNLPYGYKFNPTSVELLEGYLIPKLKGDKLPCDYVMDLHVYDYEPRQLPFNQFKHARENEAYFFTVDLRKTTVEESQIRTTPNGYWKVYKDDVPIERANEVIGFKTKLLFHDLHGNQTNLKMTEYRCRIPTITHNTKRYIVCKVKLMMEEEAGCLVEGILENENGINGSNSTPKTI